MTRHILKTTPPYFRSVWDGSKTFEVRLNDRGYQAGDDVVLREHDHWATCSCAQRDHVTTCERFTGREIAARIGYVLATIPSRNGRPGFDGRGYVVFSLVDVAPEAKVVAPRPENGPAGAITAPEPTVPKPSALGEMLANRYKNLGVF